MKTHTIIVLPDGTWSSIDGCSICVVTDEQLKDLCEDRVDAGDLTPITEIGLAVFGQGLTS